jgi:hypothetical protein
MPRYTGYIARSLPASKSFTGPWSELKHTADQKYELDVQDALEMKNRISGKTVRMAHGVQPIGKVVRSWLTDTAPPDWCCEFEIDEHQTMPDCLIKSGLWGQLSLSHHPTTKDIDELTVCPRGAREGTLIDLVQVGQTNNELYKDTAAVSSICPAPDTPVAMSFLPNHNGRVQQIRNPDPSVSYLPSQQLPFPPQQHAPFNPAQQQGQYPPQQQAQYPPQQQQFPPPQQQQQSSFPPQQQLPPQQQQSSFPPQQQLPPAAVAEQAYSPPPPVQAPGADQQQQQQQQQQQPPESSAPAGAFSPDSLLDAIQPLLSNGNVSSKHKEQVLTALESLSKHNSDLVQQLETHKSSKSQLEQELETTKRYSADRTNAFVDAVLSFTSMTGGLDEGKAEMARNLIKNDRPISEFANALPEFVQASYAIKQQLQGQQQQASQLYDQERFARVRSSFGQTAIPSSHSGHYPSQSTPTQSYNHYGAAPRSLSMQPGLQGYNEHKDEYVNASAGHKRSRQDAEQQQSYSTRPSASGLGWLDNTNGMMHPIAEQLFRNNPSYSLSETKISDYIPTRKSK